MANKLGGPNANLWLGIFIFVGGVIFGLGIMGIRGADRESVFAELTELNRELTRENETSRGIVQELRESLEDSIRRERELENSLNRAEIRNGLMERSLERAALEISIAVTESRELGELLDEILGIIDRIFPENR